MDKKQTFLISCPCDVCIVGMVCRDACGKEITWYEKLSGEDKLRYIRSKDYRFSKIMTGDSFPNFVK